MNKTLHIILLIFFNSVCFAQNKFEAFIKDKATSEILIGATARVNGTTNGSTADVNGKIEITNIPNGKYEIIFSSIGHHKVEMVFNFPVADNLQGQIIYLSAKSEELEEVTITSSTRSSRVIDDIPTRIETIAAGELEEQSIMQPGSIKMMLTESTGMQTQQTSQVSGSASIRIQGLDGKYTQLLQDGLPLYSGFASGLSILQIPPLNLKRVEIIKGSSSTLYGGGAIAGLINLITKEPTNKKEISFLVNGNQTNALDVSSFYSEKYKKTGMTVYTSGNFQKAYDNNNDGFADIPEFTRFTFNPKFFYYPNPRTTLSIGLNTGIEKRTGGDLKAIRYENDPIHNYYESNNSNRYSSQTKFEKNFSNKNILTFKNSIGYFNRKIERNNYVFEGAQLASFSEVNYLIPKEKSEWNLGLNYVTDNFQQINQTANKLDYFNSAFGVFGQNNCSVSEKLKIESGLRIDITNRQKVFILPRLSFLYKINQKLSSRVGGGLGYKMPTIFSEDAETKAFKNILPLDFSKLNAEKSYGFNADINYKTTITEDISLSVNQMFFFTAIQNPLILNQIPLIVTSSFENVNGNIQTKGFETNVKLRFDDISFYLGYTYIDAIRKFNNVNYINPLTAKHRINGNIMYELNEKLRIAFEMFYVGQQYLNNGEKTRDYFVMGISGEYKFKYFSLFANLENFLDARQSRWEAMYTGTIQDPQFRDVYTPTDGVIINGGFKLNL